MSRILVNGGYSDPAYVLQYADGKRRGETFLVIMPETVIGVGNSIGGYFARKVKYAGQEMLSLVRVSGSEKGLPVERLRRLTAGRPGFVLKPGMTGLWATSGGSARRGIYHRVAGTNDPIVEALRVVGMPSNLLREVEEIDLEVRRGGNLCSHSTREGNSYHRFATDGKAATVAPGEHVEEHSNQYHIGCQSSPDTVRVTGGTFVVTSVERKAMNGGNYSSVTSVTVTQAANRERVAGLVLSVLMPGADGGFLRALRDADAARQWIANRYEEPSVSRDEYGWLRFSFQKKEGRGVDGFSLWRSQSEIYSLPGKKFGAVAALINRYGREIAPLAPAMRERFAAFTDADAARQWILSRYRIARSGDQVEFFDLGSGELAASCNTTPEGQATGRVDDLLQVLRTHEWDYAKSLAE